VRHAAKLGSGEDASKRDWKIRGRRKGGGGEGCSGLVALRGRGGGDAPTSSISAANCLSPQPSPSRSVAPGLGIRLRCLTATGRPNSTPRYTKQEPPPPSCALMWKPSVAATSSANGRSRTLSSSPATHCCTHSRLRIADHRSQTTDHRQEITASEPQ
jgi:hypothetical protein